MNQSTRRRGPEGVFDAGGSLNVDQHGVFIHGYDVVAYHIENKSVKGTENHECSYRGVTFRFASEQNKQKFKRMPDDYLPEFGGYCAFGVANGYKDGMHPEAFEIVDGSLYFNLTPFTHKNWIKNREELIARADVNWPKIKDSLEIGPGIDH